MNWIANHLWLLPLLWTCLVMGLLVWAAVTVEGEDVMGLPIVFMAALIGILGGWGIYWLWLIFRWIAS